MSSKHAFVVPVNYFSITLGMLSIGIAWRYATPVFHLPVLASQSILTVAAAIWLIFMANYLYRWLATPGQAYAELKDIIQCCFISLIPITTILMGIVLLPLYHGLSIILMTVGIIGQLAFAAYRSGGLWRGLHSFEATTPIIYLPTVAASFASAMALGALGLTDWGMLFFGAGFFSWLSLEAAILHRLRTGEPLHESLRPIIGIQLAPAFVGCAAYLAVNGGQVDMFARFLIGYGLLNLLFLARLIFWTITKGFVISLWAYSFGFGSMAGIGAHLYHDLHGQAMGQFGIFLFCMGSGIIALLAIGTIIQLAKGKFFPVIK